MHSFIHVHRSVGSFIHQCINAMADCWAMDGWATHASITMEIVIDVRGFHCITRDLTSLYAASMALSYIMHQCNPGDDDDEDDDEWDLTQHLKDEEEAVRRRRRKKMNMKMRMKLQLKVMMKEAEDEEYK